MAKEITFGYRDSNQLHNTKGEKNFSAMTQIVNRWKRREEEKKKKNPPPVSHTYLWNAIGMLFFYVLQTVDDFVFHDKSTLDVKRERQRLH